MNVLQTLDSTNAFYVQGKSEIGQAFYLHLAQACKPGKVFYIRYCCKWERITALSPLPQIKMSFSLHFNRAWFKSLRVMLGFIKCSCSADLFP